MLRVTLWHDPEGHAFNIRDSSFDKFSNIDREFCDQVAKNSIGITCGLIQVGVVSDYTRIPITVEYDAFGPDPVDLNDWDRVIECHLPVDGREILFEGITGDEFGRLSVRPGFYRLRIFYGGQSKIMNEEGDSEDYYLVQIWPSSDTSIEVLKG